MSTVKFFSGSQEPPARQMTNAHPPVPFIFGRRFAPESMIEEEIMVLEQDAGEDERLQFIREATVLSKLAHPNIVPICDLAHDDEGRLYCTMKLVRGRTLQDIIGCLRHEQPEALGEFALGRLLTIFRKVCDAVAFAHSKGIIHRNLKPEHVMVGESGEVLLMGWGYAKTADDEHLDEHKRCETRGLKLPRKISLHEANARRREEKAHRAALTADVSLMHHAAETGPIDELDVHTDILGLGGILCALLTLRPPVEGGALLEALAITPLPHFQTGRVPSALYAVVMKALTSDKADRYQNAAALGADIEAYLQGFATAAEQAGLLKRIVLLLRRNREA
jgi:serine/threonine protein kinase